MPLNAMWVHGTAARSESIVDGHNVTGIVRGTGIIFNGERVVVSGLGGSLTTGPFHADDPFHYSQKGYWFHFAMPTPVIAQGQRMKLTTVFVLWETGPGVEVWAVHVWDGNVNVVTLPAGTMVRSGTTGSRIEMINGITRFPIDPAHVMAYGLGISVAVAFKENGHIFFFSAGGDFDPE